MERICYYILEFFFYSAAGWCIESTYCSIGEKRIINRGFLTGPMCPIYGTGALVLTILIYNPFKDEPLIVFLLGMVLCDIVEYLTSFLMETLFGARWWDYTYEFCNLHGRICLKHTLYWGVAAIGFVNLIHPAVEKLFARVDPKYYFAISIAVLCVFLLDVINAVRKALDIRKLEMKIKSFVSTLSEGYETVKTTIEEKTHGIQLSIENKSDRLSDAGNEAYEQLSDVIAQLEMRFSKNKTVDDDGKKNRNVYSSRFLHNSMSIEVTLRKQLEKLKKARDEIKKNIFENGEMQ